MCTIGHNANASSHGNIAIQTGSATHTVIQYTQVNGLRLIRLLASVLSDTQVTTPTEIARVPSMA